MTDLEIFQSEGGKFEYRIIRQINLIDKTTPIAFGYSVKWDYSEPVEPVYGRYVTLLLRATEASALLKTAVAVLNGIPSDSYAQLLESYTKGKGYGYNSIGIFIYETDPHKAGFYIANREEYMTREDFDIVMREFFTNYYKYMESLDPSEHPEWYPSYKEAVKKYYPEETQQIDAALGNKI